MRHQLLSGVAALLAICGPHTRSLRAQSVMLGQTTVSLGASADDAVRRLSREFVLKPNHGRYQTWMVQSLNVIGSDSTYRLEGQIVALSGRITSIEKIISPEHQTAVSVGEAFFVLLERIAGDGANCRVSVKRQGLESGPGAGGTILSASLKCGAYEGSLTQVQGGDQRVSPEISIAYTVRPL